MKVRLIVSIVLALFLSMQAYSQSRNRDYKIKVKKSEFNTGQEEGLNEAWSSLKNGLKYYEAGIGTYALARDHFLFAHQYNSEYDPLNYLIGFCYLYTDDKYQAIDFLRKSYDSSPDIHPDIHLHLGTAYHQILEFERARNHYIQYRDLLVNAGRVNDVMEIDKKIIECNNGERLVSDPVRIILSNAGDSVNSVHDDYFPVFDLSQDTLYFTSRRPLNDKSKRNPYDNKYYENIYKVYSSGDNEWENLMPLNKKFNRKSNDALVGISPDNTELYLYRGSKNGGDIYVAKWDIEKSKWKGPRPISGKLRSKQAEGSVHLTITGDTIYFISANKETTNGGKDIYYSIKNEKGKWTQPVNLGGLVNSSYDEEGIYLTPAGDEMFFSSKGHTSMGGFDIFYSYLRDDGTWSDPENLGYPLNSPDDELFFTMTVAGKYAYYSTIREHGVGAKDIYRITFLGAEKEIMMSTDDDLIAGLPDTVKTGFFRMPELLAIDSLYYLTGKVLDSQTLKPVFAKLEVIDPDRSEVVATAITSDTGSFVLKMAEAKNYGIEVVAKDYLFFLDAVDMSEAIIGEPEYRDFLLDRIEVGTKVVLENIYFETGKAALKPESFEQLNQVIKLLQSNETIRLEISGHTDNTGSLRVNTRLSEDRAKAVVDYLVEKGIQQDRLEWKGYAFTQPIAPNDTAEGREKNRRVEFKVISK